MITIETDLHREFEAAQGRGRKAMDHLVAAGVSVSSFMTSGWPGCDHVATVGRLWHPHPDGRAMIILPVWREPGPLYNDDPRLIDLLAFTVEQPTLWFYRDGVAGLILGDGHLAHSIGSMVPVSLFNTPIAWLRAGCQGAVILEDAERRHSWARTAEQLSEAA